MRTRTITTFATMGRTLQEILRPGTLLTPGLAFLALTLARSLLISGILCHMVLRVDCTVLLRREVWVRPLEDRWLLEWRIRLLEFRVWELQLGCWGVARRTGRGWRR